MAPVKPAGNCPVDLSLGRHPERDIEREQNAEANRFAIALLMPQHFVNTEFDALMMRHPKMHHDDLVARMAKKFAVSEPMMTMRLVELGLMVAP